MARHGMIARRDLDLLQWVDDPDTAATILKEKLSLDAGPEGPAFAKSRTAGRPR